MNPFIFLQTTTKPLPWIPNFTKNKKDNINVMILL